MNTTKLIFLGILLAGTSASAMPFECNATFELHHILIQSIKISGDLENEVLTDVVLTLNDKAVQAEHEIVRVAGPISADPKFHPRSAKLKGYEKFVLQKSKDAFYFFIPATGLDISTSYVKIYFEDTFPEIEAVDCHFL